MTTNPIALPSLYCTTCGSLVGEVNSTGRERSAYLMRWRSAHKRHCDGTVALRFTPVF